METKEGAPGGCGMSAEDGCAGGGKARVGEGTGTEGSLRVGRGGGAGGERMEAASGMARSVGRWKRRRADEWGPGKSAREKRETRGAQGGRIRSWRMDGNTGFGRASEAARLRSPSPTYRGGLRMGHGSPALSRRDRAVTRVKGQHPQKSHSHAPSPAAAPGLPLWG